MMAGVFLPVAVLGLACQSDGFGVIGVSSLGFGPPFQTDASTLSSQNVRTRNLRRNALQSSSTTLAARLCQLGTKNIATEIGSLSRGKNARLTPGNAGVLSLHSTSDGGDTPPSKGTARLSANTATPTSAIDSVLTLLVSDLTSIVLGLIGLAVVLVNRVSVIDVLDADGMGEQSRADLLAVFSAGAVLLNGISKLDVTSALAERVDLDGEILPQPLLLGDGLGGGVNWGLGSVLDATPASTAVLVVRDEDSEEWRPCALAGVVPGDESLRRAIPTGRTTPILDRFLSSGRLKESYLPTLQALPGRVEFTYLPENTQEVLLLPCGEGGEKNAVLVLGSDTAKSFTPRDIAWCQVLASRIGTFLADDQL